MICKSCLDEYKWWCSGCCCCWLSVIGSSLLLLLFNIIFLFFLLLLFWVFLEETDTEFDCDCWLLWAERVLLLRLPVDCGVGWMLLCVVIWRCSFVALVQWLVGRWYLGDTVFVYELIIEQNSLLICWSDEGDEFVVRCKRNTIGIWLARRNLSIKYFGRGLSVSGD